jgi:arylsulfatase A-like enzyme
VRKGKVITGILAVGGACSCLAEQQGMPERPNILLILTDDLGYHDLSCYGATDFATPNIDRLAASGIRFTDGYVSAPQCGPSRAGLITGVSQSRFGYVDNYMHNGLPSAEQVRTLPEQLKLAGYVNGIIGKWHIGEVDSRGTEIPGNRPHNRGFDCALTHSGGVSHYFPYSEDGVGWMSSARREHRLEQKLEKDREPRFLDDLPADTYLTDYFSFQAGEFIRRHSENPWFLFLSYNAPHTPMNAKEDLLQKYGHIKDEKRRTLAAMMDSLDQGVGEVMRVLEETGQTRRTLVWFLSDNGAPTHQNASRNDPFSGKKGDVHEGGIRVPFMVSWPGTIPSGQVSDVPVISLDILPTSLRAAGVERIPSVHDGRNILPWLRGSDPDLEARFFWSWRNKSAVRLNDLKETRNENAVLSADGRGVPGNIASDLKKNPQELPGKKLGPEQRQMLSRALDGWLNRLVQDQEGLMPSPVKDIAFGPATQVLRDSGYETLEDDFHRADTQFSTEGRVVGLSWRNSVPFVAKWGIRDGKVGVSTVGNNSVLYNTELETVSGNGTRFAVRAEVSPQQENVWSGVVFNFQDPGNFYVLRFKSGSSSYQLFRVVNRDFFRILNGETEGSFGAGRTYTVEVMSKDPHQFSFKIFEEGEGSVLAEGRAEDPLCSFSRGYAGFYQGNEGYGAPKTFFDSFRIEVVSEGKTEGTL